MGLDCLLNSQYEFKCPNLYSYQLPIIPYTNAKILDELELGPFKNDNVVYSEDILLQERNWSKMEKKLEGTSKIESFVLPISHDETEIFVDREGKLIPIRGWGVLKNGDEEIDSTYIVIDNKVHSKAVYGLLNKEIPKHISEKDRSFSGWSGIIDVRELADGCHDTSMRYVKGNQYFEAISSNKLCIN